MYSSWCAGLLTSLRLVVRCLPPVTTGRTTGRTGERRRGKKEGGREEREREKREGRRKRGEGKGEERRKWGIQAQLNHLGCLLVGGVTTGSSLSAIWSATLYPPTRCLRMSHRVRLAALVGSFHAIS